MTTFFVAVALLQTVSVESFKTKTEAEAFSRTKRLWFDGKITVCYGPEIEGTKVEYNLLVAINAINISTCMEFRIVTQDYNPRDCLQVRLLPRKFAEYLKWNFFTDCTDGPPPTVPVLPTDKPDDLVRRLLNAVAGLQYEHQREDRDEYVEIFYSNILPEYRSEFDKVPGYPPNLPHFPEYTHGDIMSVPLNYRTRNPSTPDKSLFFSYRPKLDNQLVAYKGNRYIADVSDFRKADVLYSQLTWTRCELFSAFWCDKRGPERCEKKHAVGHFELLKSYNSQP